MQINHNIAALNAWRNLGVSTSSLGGSLEKLSSGFRINRAGDDPAGLLISEQLRAQIGGLDQATRNASDAISMVQTAEGALTELNTMLNSIRSLAVHAANTGANDANSILADQTAVDKAIESIQRIATTTKFAGKKLLDGTAGTVIADKDFATTSMIVGTVAASGAILLSITTSAAQADTGGSFSINGSALGFSAGASGMVTLWLEVSGVAQSVGNYNVVGNESLASLVTQINGATATTGIRASAGTLPGTIDFISTNYGSNTKVKAILSSGVQSSGLNAMNISAVGVDIVASIGGVALEASGLVIYGSSTSVWAGTTFNLTASTNVATGYNFSIAIGDLKFSLTDDGAVANIITYGIGNMQTDKIGTTTTYANAGLNSIKSGQTYALANQPAVAVVVIDQAIADVSMERAKLGAFQKYTLESTLNNLGVTRENLAASESRIRDVDMAKEMMTFTKNQILVQAGTAMLAQANQLPQTVLQLLK